MSTVLIANPKGGSGKTTLATNLAGYFASRGRHVVLSDMDRQRSALQWLERRPYKLPLIHGLDGRGEHTGSLSADWNIVDSPAGLRGEKLSSAVKHADWVIVPMQPSAFDMSATRDFLQVLREEKSIRKERTFVAMVGMRVDSRTRAAFALQDFLAESGFPVLGNLRNAQIYALAAEQGASLFDIRPSQVSRDLQQWAPLLHWLVNASKRTKKLGAGNAK
ncbi:ParA family protein [Methylobacillus caricis]|uniref:ParA family protein n=1 Tax=Methylobacillus caricis TaxID=1971611 RepID=UPI001CFFA560|nr:ParA family protein [Methylobacillus caricis]MCB5188128.1 ParA family protein [Methylobacillus caricis]